MVGRGENTRVEKIREEEGREGYGREKSEEYNGG